MEVRLGHSEAELAAEATREKILQPFPKTLSHAFSMRRKNPKIMKIHGNS